MYPLAIALGEGAESRISPATPKAPAIALSCEQRMSKTTASPSRTGIYVALVVVVALGAAILLRSQTRTLTACPSA